MQALALPALIISARALFLLAFRCLRQSVTGATGELLDEVERFMLDVANSPDYKSAVQLAQWRERINQASLLFKVRILQSNLRQKEDKI